LRSEVWLSAYWLSSTSLLPALFAACLDVEEQQAGAVLSVKIGADAAAGERNGI
jgi:hypothetical protein